VTPARTLLHRLRDALERLRSSALAFPIAVIVAAGMIAISEGAYYRAESGLNRLVLMGQARLELNYLLRRVTEAETSKRGYLLAGGPEYLTPYLSARADVLKSLDRLRSMYVELGDTSAEQQRRRLEEVVRGKLSEMEEVLRLHEGGRSDAALELIRSGIGRELMDQMRKAVDALLATQNADIRAGLNNLFDTLLLNRIGVAAVTAIGLLVFGMFLRQGRALAQQREQRQAEIRAERDRLELEVARRTADLTELARHLQTAREDERARLARDLHDELGALLTAAKLDVARIKPKLQQAAPDLMPRLTHLIESLNGGIALKRRIIEDLRPSTLNSLGLGPALEILCNEFSQQAGVAVKADLQPVALRPGADITVFRVVQEALTNIGKYAQATEISVRLRPYDGWAEVQVRDNGVGFDPSRAARGSHGLLGMRFRVQAEQGVLEVASAPGAGTTLTARLPQRTPAPPDPRWTGRWRRRRPTASRGARRSWRRAAGPYSGSSRRRPRINPGSPSCCTTPSSSSSSPSSPRCSDSGASPSARPGSRRCCFSSSSSWPWRLSCTV
jgi:signal transduction histidine kinase